MTVRWRPLLAADIPAVSAIAARIHPDFPEDDAVFADRQAIAPDFCFLFEIDAAPAGYVLAHPYRLGGLPALNTVLGRLPDLCDTLYIHDLALLPAARGSGAARRIVQTLARRAIPFGPLSLVAVNGSVPFWSRMGFSVTDEAHLAEKLASYASDACYMVRSKLAPEPSKR
ncbi:GNAT family N-acetyltransferase [Pelagibacterium halotolerans]|uniref:GCN5-related N-acetyltransferase n=1 Tax=Pelagibacterium halotolerans (strain DSM 22347 / JCM 15775 / CGMCC 1.7692 / B2) TaxID=1082931 RepID=G4R9D4_PELHB|nr:GNAT family N-acetyltransferase [Pelagibacterium halotolerans]AEQ53468.1 GCN5-related N-acetyltransferase [Pelagibacterium halotolerans B2]QJR20352.1 GNAT family N-acetyltransferase [Pelagibacterium halotolerans]SEA59553.1 Acetyltransferase (GNAT) family protein [Pelagibacterium halotolerans]